MNVCFYGGFTSGGTERATFLVANGLKKRGFNVFIINAKKNQPTFYLDNINMDYLKSGKSIVKRIFGLKRYLKEKQIDVLVTVEAMGGIVSLPAVKMAKCKHIIWEHANYYQNQGSKYIQKIRQIELRSADAYVVLTKRDLSNFKNHFKIKTRLEQIYNIAEKRDDAVYNTESRTILSVGHIHKIKNFIVIPEIGKKVFAKHPDWCWKIFGRAAGEEYEKIKSKVAEYGLEGNITFEGRTKDMPSVYAQSALYVMTSLQEGFPMVLLEAKMNKLPLVSFNIETGPDEIVESGTNGFLIEPYNIEKMADAITELIENEKLRADFSNASHLGLEQFEEGLIVDKWGNLLGGI